MMKTALIVLLMVAIVLAARSGAAFASNPHMGARGGQ
jgi:hypothetical protein